MKKLLLLLAFLGVSSLNAQTIKSENGVYVTNTGELYTGLLTNSDENGVKKSEITIKDGKPDGESVYFYANGKVMETGNYKAGLKAGLWIRFNESGNKTAIANYLDGKKNGTWIVWDDKGVKRFEMTYQNGEKSGTWYNWDERGELVATTNYSSGN